MRIGAIAPYMPAGFAVCQPPPPDAQQIGDPVDMGDGWSATVFKDLNTGVQYIEYYNDVDTEWLWYCGVPGQDLSDEELLELTENAWSDSKKKTVMWAGIGAVAGILGGMVVASKTHGSSLLYGAVGAGAGAAAGALILTVAFRPSGYAQTAGLAMIDVQRSGLGAMPKMTTAPLAMSDRVKKAKRMYDWAVSHYVNQPSGGSLTTVPIANVKNAAQSYLNGWNSKAEPKLWSRLTSSWRAAINSGSL
jgi:hypothetical protein